MKKYLTIEGNEEDIDSAIYSLQNEENLKVVEYLNVASLLIGVVGAGAMYAITKLCKDKLDEGTNNLVTALERKLSSK